MLVISSSNLDAPTILLFYIVLSSSWAMVWLELGQDPRVVVFLYCAEGAQIAFSGQKIGKFYERCWGASLGVRS